MTLISRVSNFDTWAELQRAADERYWDGMSLATDPEDRRCGALYLWGYVAEMLLKVAYYRIRSVPYGEDLRNELAGMRDRALALGFTWRGNWHNLESLVSLLIQERSTRGRPLDAYFAEELRHHIDAIAENWSETLRYKDVRALPEETALVFRSLDWLRSHVTELWS